MSQAVHRIELPLVFPHGLSAGEGSAGNLLTVARDGLGRPVLRGSALAGALRHAWQSGYGLPELPGEDLFGAEPGADDAMLRASPLEVPDSVVDCGRLGPITRTHNQINRHTGAALDGAVFSIESLPPHSTVTAVLWLHADHYLDVWGSQIAARLAALLDDGLLLGGKSNRGLGMARLRDTVRHRRYDLARLEDHAELLDHHRQWREGQAPATGQAVTPDHVASPRLVVDVALAVPRGQDFLVGDHASYDSAIPPQRVTGADGQAWIRLPGSSLRGVMRAWVQRLAAREGKSIADSLENYRRRTGLKEKYDGNGIGWGFLPEEKRKPGATINCPVANLFGSLASAGRLHVSDALAPEAGFKVRKRTHVAVDRITGGACEGLLFSNEVVTAEASRPAEFNVRLIVRHPQEHDARWIAAALRAIDLGLIRIGSSKAGGRLALARPPQARGLHSEYFRLEVPS